MNDPKAPSDDDTTEGHRSSSSDRSTKHDVQPIESEDDDDAEGHGARIRF